MYLHQINKWWKKDLKRISWNKEKYIYRDPGLKNWYVCSDGDNRNDDLFEGHDEMLLCDDWIISKDYKYIDEVISNIKS